MFYEKNNSIFLIIVLSFGIISCKKDNDNNNSSALLRDIDGNSYDIVQIGTKCWMKENLKTTKYNDGTAIPNVIDVAEWENLRTPGYCWYDNNAANKSTYGALNNWYAVNTGKLCPEGWHVPSDAEWQGLVDYLGGEDVAGGKMKEAGTEHWKSPNTGATNESGFTGLPGGYRYNTGDFYNQDYYGVWWSSSEYGASSAWFRYLYYSDAGVSRNYSSKRRGFSVRSLKD